MPLSTNDNTLPVNASVSLNNTEIAECYIPTLNDVFDNDEVILTLDSMYSAVNKPIIIEDFLSENILYVDNLSENEKLKFLETKIIIENIRDITFIENPAQITNRDNFCQILCVDLLNENKSDVLFAIDEFKKLEFVLAAEPSYNYEVVYDSIPNDALFSQQWGLNGTYGIDVESAWKFTNGYTNPPIKVGIFEKNVQDNHPDLKIIPGSFTPSSTASANHGTHVAGIIGAIGNNSIGVSGVSQVEIALLDSSHFAESLMWAYNNGIRVVNASFHYTNASTGLPSPANESHASAIRTFSNNGGILITSAGNRGSSPYGNTDNTPQFPAGYGDARNYPDIVNVLSVGALNRSGTRNSSSNYGINSVHIYAPGGAILSTFPESNWGTTVSNYTQVVKGYATASGTSMAAPHVTGVIALLLSINKNLTVTQLKNAILNSAENINIAIPDGSTQTVRKLNAYNAVKYVLANYSEDTLILKYNTKSTSKSIDATSTFFNEKNYFLKMDVENAYEYDFTISSSCALEVTLYDSSFNKITTSQTSTNNDATKTFSHYLSVGTYYLKTNYLNSSANGTINVSIIGESHTHSYELKYYNYKWHKLTCGCGDTTGDVSVHTILQSEIVNNRYAKCLGCKQRLDLNKDMALIGGMNSLATKMSKNGSYILPSGIIVLVEEDIEAYLDGTLVFYVKDKVPVIQ